MKDECAERDKAEQGKNSSGGDEIRRGRGDAGAGIGVRVGNGFADAQDAPKDHPEGGEVKKPAAAKLSAGHGLIIRGKRLILLIRQNRGVLMVGLRGVLAGNL